MARLAGERVRVEVVSVGSELLLDRVNTDLAIIGGRLAQAGLAVARPQPQGVRGL